jgi:hypothetical protein
MKRIYDWIAKANQVLLFFVIIGGTALVSYLVYQSSRRYEPPHVSVAQTAEEAKGSVVEDVAFLGESSGIYVLGIVKRVVTTGGEPWLKPSIARLGNGDDAGGETVNVVFSKGEERVRTLLQKDGLVLSHNVGGQYGPVKIKALLFRCVTEDTDGNRRLDQNDRNDLYVVSEDLGKPDIVVKGIVDFRVISPTHMAVKTGEGNVARFWDIDTETQAEKGNLVEMKTERVSASICWGVLRFIRRCSPVPHQYEPADR